jgi:signal transduction histidine kinase
VAVEELAARAVLPVAVTGSLPHRLPEAVEINAYFFVSEALTNTVKHADAARAVVAIEAGDDVLTVEVRDDGVGGAAVDGAGSGLAGLADRVRALGGRMDLTSPPGRGTTVRAEIPMAPG